MPHNVACPDSFTAVRTSNNGKVYLANSDGTRNPTAWVDISSSDQTFVFAHDSVLLKAARTSAAIYKVHGMTNALMERINHMVDTAGNIAISARCDALVENGCSLEFVGFAPDPHTGTPYFQENLDLLNPRLQKVIAYMLQNHFFEHNPETNLNLVTQAVIAANPCGIAQSTLQYPYMIKAFLYAVHCGMTASALWDGTIQNSKEIMLVRTNGETLAYYTPKSDAFKAYLFNNCYLEFPAPDEKHGNYAEIYKEDSDYYFRLNFQICCR